MLESEIVAGFCAKNPAKITVKAGGKQKVITVKVK
jgi:hypothetical protein